MEVNAKHLRALAKKTAPICPSLSRFYLARAKEVNKQNDPAGNYKDIFKRCPYCFDMLTAGNHSVKLLPRPKLTKKLRRLMVRYQAADSGSMGKFQRKLVENFKNGINKVVIRCGLCGKIKKYDGQSRTQKLVQKKYQREHDAMKTGTDTVKVLTKKEKKKEKKKLRKKRLKEKDKDEEKNAGLLLPGCSMTVHTDQNLESGPGVPARGVDFTALTDNEDSRSTDKQSYTPSHLPHQDTSQPESLNRDRHLSYKNTVSASGKPGDTVCNSGTIQRADLSKSSILIGTSPASSVAMATPAVSKGMNKKNKVKMKGQQLSNLLKREQVKKKEGSLADFLSNL